MELFNNSSSTKYINKLKEYLTLDYLIESAFKLDEPITYNAKKFTHSARINFLGVAATELLDRGRNFLKPNASKEFESILKNVDQLNEKGILLRVRFLMIYPFSVYAFSLIHAEKTANRSSIMEKDYKPNYLIPEQVDNKIFLQSRLVRSLFNSLEHLQELRSTYKWYDNAPNSLAVRFSLFSPNICSIIINDIGFYYPIQMAKLYRQREQLALDLPVIHMKRTEDESTKDSKDEWRSFCCLADHFRYLWRHHTTLECEDATHYDLEHGSLSDIKQPVEIKYEAKIQRLINRSVEDKSSHPYQEDIFEKLRQESAHWKVMAKHQLIQFSTTINPSPQAESMIISCSWKPQKDNNLYPNNDALQLQKWLEDDMNSSPVSAPLSINIMVAREDKNLSEQIYTGLKNSTSAIFLLTPDIKSNDGKFYSRPNIYHELGFLMNRLDQLGPGRYLVLRENSVEKPSNIADTVHKPFVSQQLCLIYIEVLDWINKFSHFIDKRQFIHLLEKHMQRIKDLAQSNHISVEQSNGAIDRIKSRISKLQKDMQNKSS